MSETCDRTGLPCQVCRGFAGVMEVADEDVGESFAVCETCLKSGRGDEWLTKHIKKERDYIEWCQSLIGRSFSQWMDQMYGDEVEPPAIQSPRAAEGYGLRLVGDDNSVGPIISRPSVLSLAAVRAYATAPRKAQLGHRIAITRACVGDTIADSAR